MIRHKDYLLVQAPEGSWDHAIANDGDNQIIDYFKYGSTDDGEIPLPPGTWQLIGLSAELTEGQLTEVGWENVPGKLLKTTTVILKQIQ